MCAMILLYTYEVNKQINGIKILNGELLSKIPNMDLWPLYTCLLTHTNYKIKKRNL